MIIFGGTGRVGSVLQGKITGQFLGKSDCDLRIADEVKRCLDYYSPSQVIHLAATCGSNNKERSYEYFYDNILMGLNIFHECIQRKIRLIVVSSAAAYSGNGVPREGELHNAAPDEYNFSYAFSKRSLDAQRVSSKYTNCVILYPSNLYGPHDSFGDGCHVIPSLWSRMNSQDRVTVHNADSIRQFLYLEDFAKIIAMIVMDREIRGELNVVPKDHHSIREVALELSRIVGYQGQLDIRDGGDSKIISSEKFVDMFPDFQFVELNDGLSSFHRWCEGRHDSKSATNES